MVADLRNKLNFDEIAIAGVFIMLAICDIYPLFGRLPTFIMNALLRFTIENFRSFSERKSLLLTSRLGCSSDAYIKACALYGANSSGKSNLVSAFSQYL